MENTSDMKSELFWVRTKDTGVAVRVFAVDSGEVAKFLIWHFKAQQFIWYTVSNFTPIN